MKILFDHHLPFWLAHGGFQTQLEQTMAALERIGVQTGYVRWWDSSQRADVIHFAGRPSADYIAFAHGKGCKVVMAELLTGPGSRSRGQLALQKYFIRLAKAVLPRAFTARLAWDAYRQVDASIALTPWEAHLMVYLFNADAKRVHVVPNGVENAFLNSHPVPRGKWLVCTATIAERKRVLELAEAAIDAQTPVWIAGKAYSDSDPYAQKFFALAKRHPEVIRYEGPISDRERLALVYREARGFVLLSTMESRSISSEEASACGCPLLLSDLPWARTMFHNFASYCPIVPAQQTAKFLKQFYDTAPALPVPPKPASWDEVAVQFKTIYERILSTSR